MIPQPPSQCPRSLSTMLKSTGRSFRFPVSGFRFTLLLCALCVSVANASSPPPLPKPPAAKKPVLSATRQTTAQVGMPERTPFLIASKLTSRTNFRWWGDIYTTNLPRLVTVDLTNAAVPRVTARLVIRYPVQTTMLVSGDLGTWEKVSVIGTNEILVPNRGKEFFRVALPNQTCSLEWDASPTFNVVGYNIYVGTESGVYKNQINVGNVTRYVASGLVPGMTYYFAVTAYDVTGIESVPSTETVYTAPVEEVKATITGIE